MFLLLYNVLVHPIIYSTMYLEGFVNNVLFACVKYSFKTHVFSFRMNYHIMF